MQLAATTCCDAPAQRAVSALPVRELQRLSHALAVDYGLALPDTTDRCSAGNHLDAVERELAARNPLVRTFPAREAQISKARHAVEAFLAGVPDITEDTAYVAMCIVSELATNSVLHSKSREGGTFTVRAEILSGCVVWVEVEDAGGEWEWSGRHAREEDQDGRGLELVEGLCENWGIENLSNGRRVVWARLGSK